MNSRHYLELFHLSVTYDVTKGLFSPRQLVRAVNDVSFTIDSGETFGLVGESGCGKSSLGRAIVGINKPSGGKILIEDEEVTGLHGRARREFRQNVQMIFQDPYASLNPRMTIGEILREPMEIHHLYRNAAERDEHVVELLRIVGLKPDHIRRYPHEFSGGQRQRISIARTLAVNPRFIICDEPISALDVSIQAQIINLLKNIQKERNIAYLFIAHDIGMVKHISDRIGVMYLGHLVETGSSDEVYFHPLHPYTKALLSAIPISDPDIGKNRKRVILQGEIPSPLNPPAGCPFCTRCPYADETCRNKKPEMRQYGNHMAACFHLDEANSVS
ncbi:MAG: dipeptide ABC transporter ATP-binding protein [Clostridia bacterium]|nr:dipeptide ABC transporter ATP-binding protein [Clostridia bacterium]